MQFTLALAMQPPDHLLPLARAAEEAGWDRITVPDAIFYPRQSRAAYPYTSDGERFWEPETPFVDPWVAIPAMAAVTDHVGFTTNVTKMPIREPLAVAKTVSSAAAMAPGRVGIGVGLAWMPEEFAATGTDKRTRGARLDEQIEILRRCTSPGFHEFHGEHYDFDELLLSPVPDEPIPIWVGGHSAPALDRAARLGDGWVSAMVSVDEVAELTGDLRSRLQAQDRDPDDFDYAVTPMVPPTVQDYRSVFDAGATEVVAVPWYFYTGQSDELDDKIAGVQRFAEEVIAPLRGA